MVEDDSSIAAGLSYALEKEGYLVTLCRKISQAFEEIKTVHFDLALLDMQLPDGLGKEIGQKLLAELTALEYRLLLIFAENQSILLTREQLLERIWDISGDFVEDNTLTVYVKRLRKKLGDAVQISTVRGIGYRVDQ